MNSRVAKISKPNLSDPRDWEYTYYSKDASGNTMAVYARKSEVFSGDMFDVNNNKAVFTPIEYPIYGSSRLGNYIPQSTNSTEVLYTLQATGEDLYSSNINIHQEHNDYLNSRNYELNDHLGNVSATVSDYKIANEAQQLSAHVYYPFGMELPSTERCVAGGGYRYGFNGMEHEDDVSEGSYDFGARLYNSQIARWNKVDELYYKYPFFSPYMFTNNNPITSIDFDGNDWEIHIMHPEGDKNGVIEVKLTIYTSNKFINGLKIITSNNEYVAKAAAVELNSHKEFTYQVETVDNKVVNYDVKFNVQVVTEINENEALEKAGNDKSGNFFTLLTFGLEEKMPIFVRSGNEKITQGDEPAEATTHNHKYIFQWEKSGTHSYTSIESAKKGFTMKNLRVVVHEFLHLFTRDLDGDENSTHTGSGTYSAANMNDAGDKIDISTVKNILETGGVMKYTKSDFDSSPNVVKGSETGEKPKNFENGEVKVKK